MLCEQICVLNVIDMETYFECFCEEADIEYGLGQFEVSKVTRTVRHVAGACHTPSAAVDHSLPRVHQPADLRFASFIYFWIFDFAHRHPPLKLFNYFQITVKFQQNRFIRFFIISRHNLFTLFFTIYNQINYSDNKHKITISSGPRMPNWTLLTRRKGAWKSTPTRAIFGSSFRHFTNISSRFSCFLVFCRALITVQSWFDHTRTFLNGILNSTDGINNFMRRQNVLDTQVP